MNTEIWKDIFGYEGRIGALTVTDVVKIRRLIERGEVKTATIAAFYRVTSGAINPIRRGRTFQWLV